MKLSIIVPAYNCADTIGPTLDSILSQQYSDFELIVINDGSTDGTQAVLERYAQADSRLRPVCIPNGGPSNARNTGIREARGDYLTFVDADDLLLPQMYQEMMALATEHDLDEVVCGYTMENVKQGVPISAKRFGYPGFVAKSPEEFRARLIPLVSAHLMYVIWNKIYRTSVIRDNGILFPLDFKSGEDRLFNARLFPLLRSFACIDQPFYRYLNDEKGLNARFVPNRFEAALSCHQALSQACRDMEISGPETEAVLSYQFVKGVMSCFTQLSVESCPLTGKQKKDYIRKILQNDEVQLAIRKNGRAGGSAKLATAVLRTGSPFLIRLTAFGIFFLQHRMNRIYLALKHR